MLDTDPHRKTFCLERPAPPLENLIDVPGGMTGSQDNLAGPVDKAAGMDLETAFRRDDVRHAAVEMVLSPMVLDAAADIFDNPGQPVRPQMRMGIDEDVRIGPETDQLMEHFPDVAPFGRTGEQFPVREGTGTALAVAIVRIRVDDTFHGQFRHVRLAAVNILSPFQDDRFPPAGQ